MITPQSLAYLHQKLHEAIVEPKRPPQTIHQIGVTLGGGLQNILKVLASATPAEKEFWAKWYHYAKAEVQELAKKNHMPFDRVAAAVAALSPGSKWRTNMVAAERLCNMVFQNPGATVEQLMDKLRPGSSVAATAPRPGTSDLFTMGESEETIPSYTDNLRKALRVLMTGDVSEIMTRKVWVFWRGIVDPDGVQKEIDLGSVSEKTRKMLSRKTTVDGHAINVWRGFKTPLDEIGSAINDKLFDKIEKDYQEAARITGLSTRAIQAITWYIWKYTMDPVPPPRLTITPPTPGAQATSQVLNPEQFKQSVQQVKAGTLPPGTSLDVASRNAQGGWQWSPFALKKKK